MICALRLDVSKDYSEENTIVGMAVMSFIDDPPFCSPLAPRVQFLAIEIARNRTGLNSPHLL